MWQHRQHGVRVVSLVMPSGGIWDGTHETVLVCADRRRLLACHSQNTSYTDALCSPGTL